MNIGIIGGGQLGQMLALAGIPLGLNFRVLDPTPNAPASQVACQVVGSYDDPKALEELATGADLVTYEFENVPVQAARQLATRLPVHPNSDALEAAQDRLVEKTFFQNLGLPTPAFVRVDTADDLAAAIDRLGLPVVLKTRRLGYDGKGQFVIRDYADRERAWAAVGGQPLILESFVNFERELSILGVRGHDGLMTFYPVVENHHFDGILRLSKLPIGTASLSLQTQAEFFASRVLESLKYVGVLAIELFQCSGQLLANEMAPRVHNSGHWTIEGAVTSQFENHLRAISGLPLGSTKIRSHAAMLNLIGRLPDTKAVLTIPGAHLHLYGKAPRPGRKLGHITVTAESATDLQSRIASLQSLITENQNE